MFRELIAYESVLKVDCICLLPVLSSFGSLLCFIPSTVSPMKDMKMKVKKETMSAGDILCVLRFVCLER